MKLFLTIAFCMRFISGYSTDIQSVLLETQQTFEHQVEIFIKKPRLKSSPLLIFLHGASTDRGIQSLSKDWLEHWSQKGYAIAAISMPGFGQTTGRKDFCGPFTLKTLHFAIDAIKAQLETSHFSIIGFGQGSIAALLLASERPDIHCLVSSNGGYDLLSHLQRDDPLCKTLLTKNYALAFDETDFKMRSPIERVPGILY